MTTDTATPDHTDDAAGDPRTAPATADWPLRLRRFGHIPRQRTDTRERLVPPFPEPGTRMWQALGAGPGRPRGAPRWAAGAGSARSWSPPSPGVLRFWRLGSPRAVVFDETYYAKDAWSLLQLGYEGNWPDRKVTDPQILGRSRRSIPLSDAAATWCTRRSASG